MSRMLLVQLFLVLCVTAFAQDVDLTLFNNMNMRAIGPAGMSGRVTSIDAVVSNPAIIYAGTASGGLWKSESGGVDWQPVFDEQPLQSIGAVAICQSNPSIVWAGTGEGNPRNSQNSGEGIYKSIDGGRTWQLMGLKDTRTIHRIRIDPTNPDVVYVAAHGSAWGPNEERGVFRTRDGGQTWEKVLYVNNTTGCAELVMDPSNPNKLMAAMWEYGRKPWTFKSGGEGSGLFISFDGGSTWQERTDKHGLPKKPLGRMGLAISASEPQVMYALIEAEQTGLYRSNDGGFSWKLISTQNIGNRPFYYAEIYVDPKNENRLFNLYSMVSKSEDGGKTFEVMLPYSGVHPDHHAFWIHPENPRFMIDGNDGGLNISHDGGKNWEFMSNLPLGQFYHINYDMELPYNVYGGMQDNGSWRGPAYVWHYDGIRNENWRELLFGDGFDVVPNPGDPRYAYAMYQGGNVYEVDTETGASTFIRPVKGAGEEELRFNWNAGIAADPFNTDGLYYGSQFLHHSTDRGRSWEILSPDLTTNDTTKQKQALSGGLTIDATAAENHTTIICIAPSELDKQVIWVGTDDGNVQLTRDGGKSWTNLSPGIKGMPAGAWVPMIVAGTHNAAEAFVVVNDYRRNNWKPYLFHTTDYGKSWKRLADEQKVQGHCLSVIQDPVASNLLFLGTEYGLFVSFNKGESWQKWTRDYPSVPTIDLKIHPREHDLIIGTFGRAAFILDDIRPLREVALRGKSFLNEPLYSWNGNDAYLAHYRRPDGARFVGDHYFSGENRPSGARIPVYVHPDYFAASDEESKKEKKFKVAVLSLNGDTLRNFSADADTGINYIGWWFDRNGSHWPSRAERKKDADPPSGQQVGPGEYELRIVLGDEERSSSLKVVPDPRVPFDQSLWNEKEALHSRFETCKSRANAGFERLKDAGKSLDLLEKNMVLQSDSVSKNMTKSIKSMRDSLAVLEALYMTPKDFNGYDHVTQRLTDQLYAASSYLGEYASGMGSNVEFALTHAEDETDAVLDRINAFFSVTWNAFSKEVQGLEFPLYKEFEPLE